MDLKDFDLLAVQAIDSAIRKIRAEHYITNPNVQANFQQSVEYAQAKDAVSLALRRYWHDERQANDADAAPDEIDMSRVKFKGIEAVVGNILPPLSGSPYPPEPTVYSGEIYGEGLPKSNRLQIFSAKSGYAHKVVSGKLASGMTSGNALLMLQHEYDPMPFGYRDFNYNERNGYFVITIHTD